ncbi:SRPBCC family protein [Paracoccaceae bacterium GXU_MW_L88]
MPQAPHPSATRELRLERVLDASVENIWRCWMEPELLGQWFCPKPWYIDEITLENRPGGRCNFTMHGPDGEVMPQRGQYLALETEKRIVTTDAFVGDWMPSENPPFMTAEILLERDGEKTRYTAIARHWSDEARKQHEEMGFHEGWGICADQLEALAKTL